MREIREKNFTIRLSQKEYDEISREAEALKLSMGAYIRMIVFSKSQEVKDSDA